jgi:hypothetical protein
MGNNLVSICIPFHLRGRKSNASYMKAFRHYGAMGFPLHLCGSEGKLSREFARPFVEFFPNVKYFEIPQKSITISSSGDAVIKKKFNDSLATLPNTDWQCIIGADDIISQSYFDHLLKINPQGSIMSGVRMENPIYMLDMTKTKRNLYKFICKYSLRMDLAPGINTFSKQAIKEFKGNMYYGNNGCETGAEIEMRSKATVMPLDGQVILLKGETVLNGVDHILRKFRPMEMTTDEQKRIYSLIESL